MGRLRRILLVEDDAVDALTVKRAFQELGGSEEIIHLSHGQGALAYLDSELNHRPDLILLDLNMPGMSGFDVLYALKHDRRLRSIPVVVLTTSDDERDILACFASSAAAYLTKPVEFDQFKQRLQAVVEYWSLNRLPGSVFQEV